LIEIHAIDPKLRNNWIKTRASRRLT